MLALDLIKRSLRILTVVDAEEDLTAVQGQTAVIALNAMMAEWEDNGLDLGYTPITNTASTLTVPEGAIDGIAFNLAQRLAPEYGMQLSQADAASAAQFYQSLLKLSMQDGGGGTAAEVLKRALRVAGIVYKNPGYYLPNAIPALNAMMAEWESSGLDLGYTPINSISDSLTVPPESIEAIVYNLAARLAPEYGLQLSQQDAAFSVQGYQTLLRESLKSTGGSTVVELLRRAIRLSGIPYKTSSYYLSDALQALNEMMARWEADGVSTGWIPVAATTDTLRIPMDAREAVAYNLAVKIAAEHGTEAPATVMAVATSGYGAILRDSIGKIVTQNVGPLTYVYGWDIQTGQ